MANRPSRLVVPAYEPSFDGRYHLRYANGDKPVTGAELAGDAAASASAAASITAAIRMRAEAQSRASASAGMSSSVRLAAAAQARAAATASMQDPLNLPLLQREQITYLGTIRLPDPYNGIETLNGGLGLGRGPAGQLIASGGQNTGEHLNNTMKLARFTIPSIGGTCTGATNFTNVPGIFTTGTNNFAGTMYHEPTGKILYQKFHQYNGDTPSAIIASCDINFANHTTPQTISGTDSDFKIRGASGYISRVPEVWQGLVGKDCFMGGGPQQIDNNTACGPGFLAFNASDVDGSGAVPVTTLLGYNDATKPSDQHLMLEINAVSGAAIIPGTRTCLYFGSQGIGNIAYLQPPPPAPDPCFPNGSGFHAYPYQFCFWAYDMRDLVAVKNGSMARYAPRPVDAPVGSNGQITGWAAPGPAGVAGCNQTTYMSAFFDPDTMRIYVVYRFSRDIEVYQVTV